MNVFEIFFNDNVISNAEKRKFGDDCWRAYKSILGKDWYHLLQYAKEEKLMLDNDVFRFDGVQPENYEMEKFFNETPITIRFDHPTEDQARVDMTIHGVERAMVAFAGVLFNRAILQGRTFNSIRKFIGAWSLTLADISARVELPMNILEANRRTATVWLNIQRDFEESGLLPLTDDESIRLQAEEQGIDVEHFIITGETRQKITLQKHDALLDDLTRKHNQQEYNNFKFKYNSDTGRFATRQPNLEQDFPVPAEIKKPVTMTEFQIEQTNINEIAKFIQDAMEKATLRWNQRAYGDGSYSLPFPEFKEPYSGEDVYVSYEDYAPSGVDRKSLQYDPVIDENSQDITLDQYQEGALKTARDSGNFSTDLANASMKFAGEVSEVVEPIAKHLYHGHKLNREALTKELGDVLYYIAWIADIIGVNLGTVAQENRKKLRDRYPNGFDEERSKLHLKK